MGNKYFDGKVTNKNVTEDLDNELKELVNNLKSKLDKDIDTIHLIDALDHIFEVYRRCNKHIDETTPWSLAKDENAKDRLETVLYNLLESIRATSVLLSSFLPETSDKIMEQLNNTNKEIKFVENNIYNLNTPTPLFMRIDTKNE